MPHVDEGTLHALLDGALRAESPGRAAEVEAHLAACGDCRARLEAAEELRGEASGILDAAIPDDLGATPDFSDVVRRAEAAPGVMAAGRPGSQPDRLRRQARWTRGVAWAASLVLALGTGYLIRDLTGPPIDDVPSGAIRSEAAEAAPAGSGAAAGEADGEAADAGDAGADAVSDDRTTAPRSDEPQVDRPAAAPGEGTATESVEAEREATEPVPPAPVPTPAPQRMAEADAATKQAETRDTAPPAGAARAAAPEAEPVVADRVEEAEPVEGLRVTALGQAATRWSPVTVEEAREILDGPFYVLPRAQLQNLYTRADAGRQEVLSLQRLQTGVPIQVLQWRGEDEKADGAADRAQRAASVEGAAPTDTALPFAALPEANVVRVVRDEFVLELTGSLPAALLSVLGETADPAQ